MEKSYSESYAAAGVDITETVGVHTGGRQCDDHITGWVCSSWTAPVISTRC